MRYKIKKYYLEEKKICLSIFSLYNLLTNMSFQSWWSGLSTLYRGLFIAGVALVALAIICAIIGAIVSYSKSESTEEDNEEEEEEKEKDKKEEKEKEQEKPKEKEEKKDNSKEIDDLKKRTSPCGR